ncbi:MULTISPECIES: DUF6056 family protein [unclassified Citrobacter]|uniref:DUF6056 family protein n=1 Tax=unclassified Citrobacter TaxID=2644389 RepID=UPI00129BE33F|nr:MULTISPECIES: DUF6056 family protein [unclassified Citrobacter]
MKFSQKVFNYSAVIVFFIFFITFINSPLQGEDFGLSKHFTNQGIIERLAWAFSKSANQITTWNARLGEQFAIYALSMPDVFFIFVASLSFLGLPYIILKLFSDDVDFYKFSVALLCMFSLWPGMELFFWRTVVAGYTIPMIITLFVCNYFMNTNRLLKLRDSKYFFVAPVLGFLTGLSFENVPVATIFFMISVLILMRKLFSRLSLIPLFTFFGWATLMLAPSTRYRSHMYNQWYHHGESFIYRLPERALDVINVFFSTSWMLFYFSIAAVIYLIKNRLIKPEHWLMIISSILVSGSMLASPYTEARSFMFSWCVMVSFIACAICNIKNHKVSVFICIVIAIMSLSVGYETYNENKLYNEQISKRSEYINSLLNTNDCKTGIKINLIKNNSDYRYVNNRDEWFYRNTTHLKEYYGCEFIGVKAP